MWRVGPIRLSSYRPDSKQAQYIALPDTLIQGPSQLLLVEHPEQHLPGWAQWAKSSQGQRQRMHFSLMSDSSPFDRQSWNFKVQHAYNTGQYWHIDLPSRVPASASLGNAYQLIVLPKQRDPARDGMWTVRAWLIHKHEVMAMRTTTAAQMHPEQTPASGTAGGDAAAAASSLVAASGLAPPVPVISSSDVVAAVNSVSQRYQSDGIFMYRALHSLSQMHEEWPFGAIAELMDNALDADAGTVHVDLTSVTPAERNTLTFLDDGCGMSFDVLRSMLSQMGWSNKGGPDAPPDQIGKYGQGFKTGVFRLGAAVLVLTKPKPASADTQTDEADETQPMTAEGAAAASSSSAAMASPVKRRPLGHSSPTNAVYPWSVGFLALPGADCNPTPFSGSPEWNQPVVAHTLQYGPARGLHAHAQTGWQEIIERSSVQDVATLAEQFRRIQTHGTLIIISRLRVFDVEKHKMELAAGASSGKSHAATDDIQLKHLQTKFDTAPKNPFEYSMRAFVSVLYRKPRMRIVLQGHVVPVSNIEASLRRFKGVSNYHDRRAKYVLDLGFSQSFADNKLKGIMMYNGNRLISSFQFSELLVNWGHVGIMDTSAIRPEVDVVNNKQRYVASFAYLKLSAWIRVSCGKFEEHLETVRQNGGDVLEPDDAQLHWIQCTQCRAWRTYPQCKHEALRAGGFLEENATWECKQNEWDASQASCHAPEPLWDAPDESASVESSGDLPSGKSKRTQLRHAMAQLAAPSLALMEPRDFSLFESQVQKVNLLGKGSAAEVYQVLDGHRLVALKRFTVTFGEEAGMQVRHSFERELITQRAIVHPNVVAALGWVDHPDLCLLTEFVPGVDLSTALHGVAGVSSPITMTATQKHAILVGIADGMTAIHREHIIHGDIKPANIMLEGLTKQACAENKKHTTDAATAARSMQAAAAAGDSACSSSAPSECLYTARICDFGLARRVREHGQTLTTNQGGPGRGAGTLAYMSPEQCEEDGDDDEEEGTDGGARTSSEARKAADVWSFAMVALELLTGAYVSLVNDERVTEMGAALPTSKLIAATAGARFTLALIKGRVPWCDRTHPAVEPYFELLRECFARDPAARPTFAAIFKRLQAVTFEQLHPGYVVQHASLWRVLSHGDGRSSLSDGVRAKLEHSARRPEDHVAYGSRIHTHFLSTTASFAWALYYWCKIMVETNRVMAQCPWIIEVQLRGGEHDPRVITHDMRNYLAASGFRGAFGTSADEVLIEKHIPAECITQVYDLSRSQWADKLLQFSAQHCCVAKHTGNSLKGYTDWLNSVSQRSPFKQAWMKGTILTQLQRDCKLQPVEYMRNTQHAQTVDDEQSDEQQQDHAMSDATQQDAAAAVAEPAAEAGAVPTRRMRRGKKGALPSAVSASSSAAAAAAPAAAASNSSSPAPVPIHYSVKKQRGSGSKLIICRSSSVVSASMGAGAGATRGSGAATAAHTATGAKRKRSETRRSDSEVDSDGANQQREMDAPAPDDYASDGASDSDSESSDSAAASSSSSSSSSSSDSISDDDSSYCASDSGSEYAAAAARRVSPSAVANLAFKQRQRVAKRQKTLFETFRQQFYHREYKQQEGAAAFNTPVFAEAARKRFTGMSVEEQEAYAKVQPAETATVNTRSRRNPYTYMHNYAPRRDE